MNELTQEEKAIIIYALQELNLTGQGDRSYDDVKKLLDKMNKGKVDEV